jgi:hypothetical protein
VDPDDEVAVQKLYDSRRILPQIATALRATEAFSSAFEGPFKDKKLLFVAAHADPPGE